MKSCFVGLEYLGNVSVIKVPFEIAEYDMDNTVRQGPFGIAEYDMDNTVRQGLFGIAEYVHLYLFLDTSLDAQISDDYSLDNTYLEPCSTTTLDVVVGLETFMLRYLFLKYVLCSDFKRKNNTNRHKQSVMS